MKPSAYCPQNGHTQNLQQILQDFERVFDHVMESRGYRATFLKSKY